MTVDEVVVRSRQEALKWLDRNAAAKALVTLSKRLTPGRGGVRGRAAGDRARAAHHGPDIFREEILPRFFDGAASADATARLIERIPESRERIVSSADSICAGRFDLLGYRGLYFGDPVDWHLDPVSGRRAPVLHWSRLDPLDPAVVGDAKVIWELNRHQWLLPLGQAYRFTGDRRYAEVFARSVREWMAANPVGIGINWDVLTAALRLISWCWAITLFDARALPVELFVEMRSGIHDHARHVERYLSSYSSPNTHLTGEALGLVYAGIFLPESPRARRWLARGAEILLEQCERQIFKDGVYFEQSTCYQRYTAEIYLHFLILAHRTGIKVPNTVGQRVQRLLDFLLAVRRPDGSMPLIGDADGGSLAPFIPRPLDDVRGVFSIAAALFGRSDYAWAAGGVAPEVLWLLGPSGAKACEALSAAPPLTASSQVFPDGGYVVMRSGWEPSAHQVVLDAGPLGGPISGVHGHADLLSIQCAISGEPYLVDPGTYCYAPHPAWRTHFRCTAAHSTVLVDGQGQAVPAGPFKWESRPTASLRRWLSTEAWEYAEAEHDAYVRLPDPVRHRRGVLFIQPRFWVIVDDLEGRDEHRVELRFQFAPMAVTVSPDLWTRARGSRGGGLLLRPFTTALLTAEIHEGETAPIQGWVCRDYGQRQPAPAVAYAGSARLPLRMLTLLLPTPHPSAPVPAVFPLTHKDGRLVGLVLPDEQVRLRFGENGAIDVGPAIDRSA